MSRIHPQVYIVVQWNVENTEKFFLLNYRCHFLIFDMVKLLVNHIGKRWMIKVERKYLTKEEVDNRAIEAKGMTLEDLSVKGYISSKKSSFCDAFENWFGKQPDNECKPDIEEAGVELKTTPFKRMKNNKYSVKERLVLNMINYHDLIHEDFDTSRFLKKNGTLEIAFYENELHTMP